MKISIKIVLTTMLSILSFSAYANCNDYLWSPIAKIDKIKTIYLFGPSDSLEFRKNSYIQMINRSQPTYKNEIKKTLKAMGIKFLNLRTNKNNYKKHPGFSLDMYIDLKSNYYDKAEKSELSKFNPRKQTGFGEIITLTVKLKIREDAIGVITKNWRSIEIYNEQGFESLLAELNQPATFAEIIPVMDSLVKKSLHDFQSNYRKTVDCYKNKS